MKYKNNILKAALIALLLTSSITAYAGEILGSTYTPDRPIIELTPDTDGFPYPTFNNFSNNKRILEDNLKGYEPIFLLNRKCNGFDCNDDNTDNYDYINKIMNLKADDRVAFRSYFHNNGSDPYDDFSDDSYDAENVNVGLDLDYGDNLNDKIAHPTGFIHAGNSMYKTSSGNLIYYKDTDYHFENPVADDKRVRTVSDDTDISFAEKNLKLEVLPEIIFQADLNWDDIKQDNETIIFSEDDIKNGTTKNINFTAPNGEKVTVKASAHRDGNKIWLHFNHLPGCFRYSGFVYFRAKVVKDTPPVETPNLYCKELKVDHPETIITNTVSWFKAKATNNFGNPFNEQQYYWVDNAPDGEPYGKFYLTKPSGFPDNPSPIEFEATNVTDTQNLNPGTFGLPAVLKLDNIKSLAEPTVDIMNMETAAATATTVLPFDLSAFITGKTKLTVNAGTKVYFVGLKDSNGEYVVHVKTPAPATLPTNENINPDITYDFSVSKYGKAAVVTPGKNVQINPDVEGTNLCQRSFPIVGLECKNLKVTGPLGIFPINSVQAGEITVVKAEAADTNGNPFVGDITYTINPNNGTIFSLLPFQSTSATDWSITVPQGKLVFIKATATGNNVIRVDTENTDDKDCTKWLSIEEEIELVCKDLSVNITNIESALPVLVNELEPATWYKLDPTVTYTSTVTPSRVTYTSSYGAFVPDFMYTLPYFSAQPSAESILAAYPGLAGPLTLNEDIGVYFVTKDVTIDVTDALQITATNRSEKECSKVYSINYTPLECKNIAVTYFPTPFDPTGTTLICVNPGDYGNFNGNFEFSAPHGSFFLPSSPGNSGNPKLFTIAEAASCVNYSGGQATDIVTIRAVGDLAGTNCNYQITPTGQGPTCVDLNIIIPQGTWNEDDFTDDDEQRVEIEVTTSPSGLASNFNYRWKVEEPTAGDWSNGSTTAGLINYLTDIATSDLDYIEVWAVDKTTGQALYSNGSQICIDRKNFSNPNEEEPVIEKSVYDPDKEKWRNTINISGEDEDGDLEVEQITYRADFEPGSAKSAEISENSIDNGIIKARSPFDGKLKYIGMAIAVEDNDGDKYVLFKSDDFDEDYYDDADIDGSDSLSDYLEEADQEDFDEGDFEDEYSCDNNNNSGEVCIENDFDDLEDDFSDGDPIQLRRTQNADHIYIVYQFENETSITDEECQDLDPDDGCGERFDNEIAFEAFRDDDFEDSEWEDEDEARVVVICPYVLARESGDVFFNDEVDTGADVSQCSEVENVSIIVRPREETQITPQTGGNSTLTPTISAPTHDICKISNTEDPDLPEDYRNVFESFSSTVCEMRAEVAESWKKETIVDAINKNITVLSRFGTNLVAGTLNSMANLEGVKNAGSGVFITEKDLTIKGSGENGFEITGTSNVPAAQTYIIKGANLKIQSDIKYNDKNSNPAKPKTIPSAAFIVIDGNINLAAEVKELDGIYMAVDTDGKGSDGQITSIKTAKNRLTVRGSIIGNILNLFENRRASGDPNSDAGAVTIRFDERLLLNMPPGLGELIDISHLRISN